MKNVTKLTTTLGLLAFLGGLGAVNYYATGDSPLTGSVTQQSSQPDGAVRKQVGPDVPSTIQTSGFIAAPSEDLSFLAQITGSGTRIDSLAIKKDTDWIGSVTWIDSPDAKTYFAALKEALLGAFSIDVADLKDETKQGGNQPVRNELSFYDPALSSERLRFVRVRERLYEFHLALGKEDVIEPLIEQLTTK